MKKVLLSISTHILLSTLCHAQIEKGTLLLGGNINLGSSKTENTSSSDNYKGKSFGFGIQPAIGVAIKPNTILGVQLGYSHGKSSSEPDAGSQENENYRTEFFLRKYLGLGKGFYLFAQPGVYFNRSTSENISIYAQNASRSEYNNKNWSAGVSLYPGVSYAVNKRFHLEAGLGNIADFSYGHGETENISKTGSQTAFSKSKVNNFYFSSSLSNSTAISIGFRFFLDRKTK